jgi:hypothetical protein
VQGVASRGQVLKGTSLIADTWECAPSSANEVTGSTGEARTARRGDRAFQDAPSDLPTIHCSSYPNRAVGSSRTRPRPAHGPASGRSAHARTLQIGKHWRCCGVQLLLRAENDPGHHLLGGRLLRTAPSTARELSRDERQGHERLCGGDLRAIAGGSGRPSELRAPETYIPPSLCSALQRRVTAMRPYGGLARQWWANGR